MHRLRWLLGLLVVVGLVWGGYRQYQDPRVRGLFGPAPKRKAPAPERPVQDSGGEPGLPRQAEPPRESKRRPVRAAPPLSNSTLPSTILGILAAKGLAYGISLSVTNDTIEIRGRVDDGEKRREILNVLEKSRGHRSLDSSWLVVAGSQPPGRGCLP